MFPVSRRIRSKIRSRIKRRTLTKLMSDEIALLHHLIDQRRDEIVESLQGVLRIPSKKEPAGPNEPYGPTIRDALDYTLSLSRDLGFRVKDLDGHAGHAEFGAGAEMIAALGHLDV